VHHRALRYRYLYLYQQEGVFVFVCQQHVTVFEKSVETDVMPSLLFEQRYFVFKFYVPSKQPSKRLENCKNEYQIS